MSDDIRTVLKPFATALGAPSIHRLDYLDSDDILLRMSIAQAEAVLYDDRIRQVRAPVWTYKTSASAIATYPATGIAVRRGQKLQVEWSNDVPAGAKTPIDEAVVPYAEPDPIPQNMLGLNGATPAAKVDPLFVTHLHGGRTAPNYDGWPESMMAPGQSRRVRYDNAERATMHWYHDHAMHTTAGNVYAGLAAPYIIRDGEEAALELPQGGDELPLIIQDRNISHSLSDLKTLFERGDPVIPTTLLRKTESGDGPLEFFGPLTLVNGKIWPCTSVPAKVLRLRLLNGSNSRTYALRFVETDANRAIDKAAPVAARVAVRQIGADGGLVGRSVDLTGRDIVLMPAQRIDLLVDFRGYAGQGVALLNLAPAPFGGDIRALAEAFPIDPALDEGRTPYPEVMLFEVRNTQPQYQGPDYLDIDARLAAHVDFAAHRPDPAAAHVERVVAMVEKDMGAMGAMLVTYELVPEMHLQPYRLPDGEPPYMALHAGRKITIDGAAYRVCAERFQDPVNFQVKLGATERWRFMNLSPDSHPMHVHLVQFMQIQRQGVGMVRTAYPDGAGGQTVVSTDDAQAGFADELAGVVNTGFAHDAEVSVTLRSAEDATDDILRDTVRVDPGEVVDIVARFDGYYGRYLYHCHLLEHEDHDMMRQFVVTRGDIDFAAHGGGHMGHGAPIMASVGK